MTFTDEDLEMLKERETDGLLQTWLSWDEKQALIARLEAAERLANRQKENHQEFQHDTERVAARCAKCLEIRAWRKVAGK